MNKKESLVSVDDLLKQEIVKQPPILINGVLPGEGGLILAGESEVGKSLMRNEWSVLLACGLDIYGMKTPTAQTVLVFQTENTLEVERDRIKRIMRGHRIESVHNRIHYAKLTWERSLLNQKFLGYCAKQIKEVGPTVVMWDPLISFLQSNMSENNNVGMRSVLDRITWLNQEHGCASVVVHHFGQPGREGEEIPLRYRMRGASAIRDWADTVIALQATSKGENPGPGRKLSYTKIRNGPPRKPLFLERDRNFIHHLTADAKKVTAVTIIEIITQHGEDGSYRGTQNELTQLVQEAVNCGRKTAQDAIKQAVTDGYIRENLLDGIKYWEIVE